MQVTVGTANTVVHRNMDGHPFQSIELRSITGSWREDTLQNCSDDRMSLLLAIRTATLKHGGHELINPQS
jgi:hypothetical protein